MQTRRVFRLFIASPQDVTAERIATERVVAELNRSIAPQLGVLIELVRWEDVVPDLGRPEEIILNQLLLEDCDFFVGILWNRFGTPTGLANSGTEEEFEVAYKSWRSNNRPRVMFYFCERPANLRTEEEIRQRNLVIRFRDRLSSIALFREFTTEDNFESLLRQDLSKHLFKILAPKIQKDEFSNQIGNREAFVSPYEARKYDRVYRLLPDHTLDDMVRIPAGLFLSGLSAREIVIPYDYYIDLTPVTVKDYAVFLKESNSIIPTETTTYEQINRRHLSNTERIPDHPVTLVTWFEAAAYAAWKGKRLPTQIEWEKAARGTDGRLYPWGNTFQKSFCNSLESDLDSTTPVRKFENGRSPFGCYDMVGNVFQWVNDWSTNPRFSNIPNSEKINCGGSYNRPAEHLVCWYSESDPPSLRMSDVGFRCVFVPEEK